VARHPTFWQLTAEAFAAALAQCPARAFQAPSPPHGKRSMERLERGLTCAGLRMLLGWLTGVTSFEACVLQECTRCQA
jgi:hypothetical protein